MAERRLFFALWPSGRQREQLRDALRPVLTSVEGEIVDRRNWHVTVLYIGGFPEEQIPFLKAGGNDIEHAPIRLRFDRLAFWQRPKVACLLPRTTPPALAEVVKALESMLAAFDFVPDDRVYRPHVTVARRARKFETVHLARTLDLEWTELTLVESISTPAGVSYRPLEQ